ncbi:uncharacterized protein LOC120284117 [Dioscorea cayenensis subsp. rotundata]|uniref:Uncharacterized protein LOC120284117 n=1 Tax=Dioscorea cayennensis subsp. rotundata TaxID=55577 RepID=A0AB40D3E8_DIOCR|nr:uncharacterized protein LOC120284117 [Dioscorea cayenensis subsp. rotundata]
MNVFGEWGATFALRWAEIVEAAQRKHALTPLLDAETLEKLNMTIKDVHRVDFDWVVQISNMPNGFFLIRCASHDVMQKILCGGPWTVDGLTLQFFPWQPCFEPSFIKLSRAAVRVQLHNLPVDFWEGETLETITESFGKLLKVDEHTKSLEHTHFARLCLEIDLSKPLKWSFWLEDNDKKVFVVVLYEMLTMFCYNCGLMGYGVNSYSLLGKATHGYASSGARPGNPRIGLSLEGVLSGDRE